MELLEKAYWVAHKDQINTPRNYPEVEGSIIFVKPNQNHSMARYKYFLNEYLPENYRFIDIRARRESNEDKFSFEGRIMSKNMIDYMLKLKEWRNENEKFVQENKGKKVVIYSGQWGKYWCSGYSDYTSYIERAGIYDIEDAWNHVAHCGLEKQIKLILKNKCQEEFLKNHC